LLDLLIIVDEQNIDNNIFHENIDNYNYNNNNFYNNNNNYFNSNDNNFDNKNSYNYYSYQHHQKSSFFTQQISFLCFKI
jgi:hypothetical protein